MKLIIDIPEERLDSIKHFGIKQNEVSMLERALINGIPLEDIKVEIQAEAEVEDLSMYNAGMNFGLDLALEILDNIGKAESEGNE